MFRIIKRRSPLKHFHIIKILMIATLLVFCVQPAKAALIAQVTQEGGGSQESAALKGAISTEATLFFGFGFNSFSGGTQPYGLDMDSALGLNLTWNSGDNGHPAYTFNSSNSSDFDAIATKLTDGNIDLLTYGHLFHMEFAPTDFIGGASTGPDNGLLEINNDLSGYIIDSIALDLDELTFSITEFDTTGRLDYFIEAEWQIYGHAKPVPEPSTLLLLGSGLVGLVGFGRKKFKK
jgi:hypothetical protein